MTGVLEDGQEPQPRPERCGVGLGLLSVLREGSPEPVLPHGRVRSPESV